MTIATQFSLTGCGQINVCTCTPSTSPSPLTAAVGTLDCVAGCRVFIDFAGVNAYAGYSHNYLTHATMDGYIGSISVDNLSTPGLCIELAGSNAVSAIDFKVPPLQGHLHCT